MNIKILLSLALSAASALIYEVVATSFLFFYFVESSYSISTVLSIFLLGLAIGSFLIYFFIDKIKNKYILFAILQAGVGLYALIVLTKLQTIIPRIEPYGIILTSTAILLLPSIFLGATFPLAGHLVKKKEKIGLVYSADLVGAITGTILAGFFLIPVHGYSFAVTVGAFLNLISAIIILISIKERVYPLALTVALFIIIQTYPSVVVSDTSEYQFYANTPYGEIKVEDNMLYIDGREQCGFCQNPNDSEFMMSDYALQYFCSCHTVEVLNIGLGCGNTASRALTYNCNLDVVEINPQIVLANRQISNVQYHPNFNLILDDGYHYLRTTDKKYNSILMDIENPAVIHSTNLYTLESFQLIENSLDNDGTFAIWNFNGPDKFLDIIYYTLLEVFNYVYEYEEVFLACDTELGGNQRIPKTEWEINTLDRNILPQYS